MTLFTNQMTLIVIEININKYTWGKLLIATKQLKIDFKILKLDHKLINYFFERVGGVQILLSLYITVIYYVASQNIYFSMYGLRYRNGNGWNLPLWLKKLVTLWRYLVSIRSYSDVYLFFSFTMIVMWFVNSVKISKKLG